MMRITTQSSRGQRTVTEVPGTLADVGHAIAHAEAGCAYFSFPGRIGFVVHVAEIIAIEPVETSPLPIPTKAWFLSQGRG